MLARFSKPTRDSDVPQTNNSRDPLVPLGLKGQEEEASHLQQEICCLTELSVEAPSQPWWSGMLGAQDKHPHCTLLLPSNPCQELPFTEPNWMPGKRPDDGSLKVSCLGHRSRWRNVGIESVGTNRRDPAYSPDWSDCPHFSVYGVFRCVSVKRKAK